MKKRLSPSLCALLAGMLVSGCLYYEDTVPVVGSSYRQNNQPYYSRYTPQQQSAVFAPTGQTSQPIQQDPYAIQDIEPQAGPMAASVISSSPIRVAAGGLSDIWGQPPGSVGLGVTLMDSVLRERFNDALNTTPLNSEAKWRYGRKTLMFLPNSDVYQPYRSGGNCRDGVFSQYDDSGAQESIRGLFCQQGRGADWFLITPL